MLWTCPLARQVYDDWLDAFLHYHLRKSQILGLAYDPNTPLERASSAVGELARHHFYDQTEVSVLSDSLSK